MIKLFRGYLHKEGMMKDPDSRWLLSSVSNEQFNIISPHQRSEGNASGLHFCGDRFHNLYSC